MGMGMVVDVVFTAIDPPVTDEDWRTAIRTRAQIAREVLGRHRWALGLLDSRHHPGHATLKRHNAFLGILRGAGFGVAMAVHGISLIDSYVNGYVLHEANLPGDVQQAADGLLEHVAQLPHLKEVVEHVMTGYDSGDEFEYGLELVLDALEARR
ncbi:hypothetical protein BBK82_38610 [Lentzea guizhouensis]|uniref:Tetracycline repressor TetR C-terminal domain-containing protein n=1 Tax=Lentzea guizhouensis TaxID=1586287 RepID=A0A1B2HTG1_9PSEU|nr:TetR/AcrR family transcriptional regulator C-terminal domain-containing protein [Lentzea guizhouensis]ANZ41020.1 hypothetical protein BBK82_38610 [Lentzea guizhouensis]